jgi:hypothetical protein
MATWTFPAQRLILAGSFALAVAAAPAVAFFAAPSPAGAPVAQCVGGEEPDQFTGNCVPHTVPNSGSVFSTQPGNAQIPEVLGVPCSGHNAGNCIGLAEEAQAEQVTPPPAPVISSSP